MYRKFFVLGLIAASAGLLSRHAGLSFHQAMSIAIFLFSVMGTLFFWDFRLSFAFVGTALLLLTRTIDLAHLVQFASLEVILFLIGMMVLVGLLKRSGFFAWIVMLILRIKDLNSQRFMVMISVMSALLACAVDEVTAIVFIAATIFEICDYFEVDPTPFLMIAIFATNVGSCGTVLGNPIGILIAMKSGPTFEDFLLKAFPLMLLCLGVLIMILRRWFRKSLDELDRKMKVLGANDILIRLISVPPEKELKISIGIFGLTLLAIAMHHRLELLFGLEPNTMLLAVPLVSSGLVMAWKRALARTFIEQDVEWWTLLFFMLLFAQAGTLKYTGASDLIAHRLAGFATNNVFQLTGIILWVSSIGSSMLDNVVLVAAVIPIVQGFEGLGVGVQPLWWALLFGGCFGGNITLIGSTANIVALGLLEKERNIHMTFLRWVGIGLVVGITTTAIAWIALLALPMYR